MTFAFPIWLTALLPWAGVTLYLLLGKRPRAEVPFINLWRGPVAAPRTSPSIQRMPVWIALLLAAAAVAILSAAGPRWKIRDGTIVAAPTIGVYGIESLTVAHDQVMVRVLNEGPATNANLVIERNGTSDQQVLDLPAAGKSRNYFFPIELNTNSVRVTLKEARPDMRGRSVEITRRQSWPTVKALSPLPEEVRRMIDVYTTRRPASSASPSIGIVAGDAARLESGPGVVVADAGQMIGGAPKVVSHPLTEGINWSSALTDAKLAVRPSSGWRPLVTVGDSLVLGVREQPARQAWIGFESPSLARTPEFVIFWTNAFNWVGQGGDEFQPVPGTTFASTSELVATPIPDAWLDFAPWFACVAVALSAAALAAVPRRFP